MSKPDCWQTAEAVLNGARLTLLYGPPGTGKTRAACNTPRSVYNVYLTEETPAAELRGHYVPVEGRFAWQDGPVVSAMRQGARLVLNEIDHASGDAFTFLLGALDDPEVVRVTLPTGETVKPHRDYTVVATMNGVPEDLPPALRDRFAVRVEIDRAHPDAIEALPVDLRGFATENLTGDVERNVSVRALMAYSTLRETIPHEVAAHAVFGASARDVLTAAKLAAAR